MENPTTPEEFKEWLDEQAELRNLGLISEQEYQDAKKDAKAAMIGYASQMRQNSAQLKKSFLDLGSAIVKGEEGAAVYNGGIKSAADAIDTFASKFGIIGKIVGGLVTAGAKYVAAVNDQADALFKNYQELSRNGLATGMQDTFKNLQDMGYTAGEIGKMGSLMQENSTLLANFGGTAAQGAAIFAKAAKDIQYSDIGNQMQLMGMSVDDVNKGIAGYMKIQQMSGTLQSKSAEQISQSAQDYILKQDKLTKLTGLSADQQNSLIQQALTEQGFASKQAALRRKAAAGDEEAGKQAEFNESMLSQVKSKFGDDGVKLFKAQVVGAMNNPDYVRAQRTWGDASDKIRSGSTDQADVLQSMAKGAEQWVENTEVYAQVGIADKLGLKQSEALEGSGQYIRQSAQEAEAAADALQKSQRAGEDKNTKIQVEIRQSQRNQTQATDLLTNKGIGPVTSGMKMLAKTIELGTDAAGKLGGRKGKIGGEGGGGGATSTTTQGAPAGAAALSQKLTSAGITDKTAQANILAQVAAESGGVAKEENLKYSPEKLLETFPNQVKTIEQAKQIVAQGPEAIGNVVYGGRMGNAADEGYKYRGRGIIQLTGKDNYAKFGQLVGADLVKNPDLANDPDIAQKIAVAYFKEKEKRGTNLSDINQVNKAVGFQDRSGAEAAKRAKIAENIKSAGIPSTDNLQAGKKTDTNEKATPQPEAKKTTPTDTSQTASVPLPDGKKIPAQVATAKAPTTEKANNVTGPKNSYESSLPENKAAVPPPAEKPEPVKVAEKPNNSNERISLLTMELEKLESLVRVVQKNNDINTRILQRQS